MRIGFDADSLSGLSESGIAKYITKIVEMVNSKKIECFLFSQGELKIKIKGKYINFIKEREHRFWKPYWDQFVVPRLIKKYKIDLYHAPSNLGIPICKENLCKMVLTIHDIAPVVLPEYYKKASREMFLEYQSYPGISARIADKVIAISDSTKNDICNLFDINPEKVKVIYQGVDNKFKPFFDKNVLKKYQKRYSFGNNYIIYISEVALRKNHERLIYAFADLRKHISQEFVLLLVGKAHEEFVTPLKKIIQKTGQERSIKFLDFVPDDDLNVLLSFAKLMIYPSLYEGFGLPILEAMACGCPVACSNTSSMPEVADRAACFFDPYDINSISNAIKEVISDDVRRKKMIKKGLQRAKRFPWTTTQQETFKIYKELLNVR